MWSSPPSGSPATRAHWQLREHSLLSGWLLLPDCPQDKWPGTMWQRAWNASCLYPHLRAKLCFPDCLAPRNQLKQCGNVASHIKLPSKWHGGWTMRHFWGKRITSLESRGARNWAYSDYVYVSNIWSRHTFCMFGRRSRVSLLPMTGSLCFWGLYPVAATLRNPSWPSKGPSQWWRESLTHWTASQKQEHCRQSRAAMHWRQASTIIFLIFSYLFIL